MSINDIQISKNFKLSEFECKDGGHQVIVDARLLNKTQKFREVVGVPFTPNSAYRNWSHNKAVGGSSTSQHLLGKAVDIPKLDVYGVENMSLIGSKLGFTGIGVYDNFVHFDVRGQNSLAIWDYRSNVSSSEKQHHAEHLRKVWRLWGE